jgi:hypothetical protein
LQEVNDEREAKLWVVLDWKGRVSSGGAMARLTMARSGFSEKKKGKQERWRRKGGRRLGF